MDTAMMLLVYVMIAWGVLWLFAGALAVIVALSVAWRRR